MKVGEFQTKLDVSASAYRNFMNQSGPSKGIQSDVFMSASVFFKKRQLAGVKMPRAKKAKPSPTSTSSGATAADKDGAKAKKPTAAKKETAAKKHDVSSTHLDREDKLAVPIYDTCDDLRTKINRFMRENADTTNAGFVRMINAAAFPEDATTPTIATARQMTTFLNGSGPVKGCESPAFYAAYVFFEKLRVRDGKPKSTKREEMEKVWKKKGMDREDFTHGRFLAKSGEVPHIDKYGQFKILGRGR